MTSAAFIQPILPLRSTAPVSNRCSVRPCRPRNPSVRWTAVAQPSPASASNFSRAAVATPTSPPATKISPRVVDFLSRAKEGNPLRGLEFAEKAFDSWKAGPRKVKRIVFDEKELAKDTGSPEYDVIVAGGTLGIFYACALAARGQRVAVVERGRVMGRKQEWNISRDELLALVREKVLTTEQVEAAIVNEFKDGSRIAFPKKGSDELEEIIVRGVLDLGVDPSMLVAGARERFLALGGVLYEQSNLERVGLRTNSVRLTLRTRRGSVGGDGALGAGGTGVVSNTTDDTVTQFIQGRLLIDAMGNFSPIAAQSREGQQPDGCCITVGSCLSGDFVDNQRSDLLCTVDGVAGQNQTFWEAFPAGAERDRRTTYAFSYGKCDPDRQTLASALDDYVRTMPEYQGINLDEVEVERVLFGFFPCFRDSPSPVKFDRVLPVGDAAGHQSPVSFGGFAACMRHLGRIAVAVDEALAVTDDSLLAKRELQRLQFYNPSLSAAWLFHSFMAARRDLISKPGDWNRNYINDVLIATMKTMETLGPNVQKPFLQDVVRAGGILATLGLLMLRDPLLALRTTTMGTIGDLAAFGRHLLALILYTLAAPVVCGLRAVLAGVELSQATRYKLNRLVDQFKYGAGLDHAMKG